MFFIKRNLELKEENYNLEKQLVIARGEVAVLRKLYDEALKNLDKANNDLHKALKENADLRIEINGLHERQ